MLLPLFLAGCSKSAETPFQLPDTSELVTFEFPSDKASHTRLMSITVDENGNEVKTEAKYKYVEENKDYILYFNTERLDIALAKKGANGEPVEFWYSNPTDETIAKGGGLANEMRSQLQFMVLDKKKQGQSPNKTTYGDSVSKHSDDPSKGPAQYYLTKTEDGHLKVIYIVGRLEKNYIFPTVIPATFMDELLAYYAQRPKTDPNDKLSGTTVSMHINNSYKKITWEEWKSNKLTDSKKKSYIEKVPALADINENFEPVYILTNDNIYNTDFLASLMESIFIGYGFTEEQRDELNAQYGIEKRVPNVYWIPMTYSLEEDGLKVSIDPNEIVYNTNQYEIFNLEVLKYFGAGTMDEEGYLVVPDGPGAIINFNNGKVQQKDPVRINMYGEDVGDKDPKAAKTEQGYLPVWGIKKESSSLFTVIESGSAVATIVADVSRQTGSTVNPVNYVYSQYKLVDFEEMELFGANYKLRSYQLHRSSSPINIKYSILDSEKHDYPEMAAYYREYLIKKGMLKDQTAKENIPFNLELEGAITDYTAFLGVSYKYLNPLTTFEQAQEILDQLLEKGVANINVKYRGWANGGMTNTIYKNINILSCLGGKKSFNDLMAYAKEKGINIFPETELLLVYEDKLFDGFSRNKDGSRNIARDIAYQYQYNLMTQTDPVRRANILRPRELRKTTDKLINSIKKLNLDAVDLGAISYILNGDYNVNDFYDRTKIEALYNEVYKKFNDAGIKLAVQGANVYALQAANTMFNLPNLSSEYYVTDATIPFYQMVIHGLIPYSGEAINQSGDPQTSYLNAIEFGAGLFFRWMYAENSAMKDIYFENLFSLNYSAWINDAATMYERYNRELGHTASMKMVDHDRISATLSRTVYEDGTTVYVNYADTSVTYNGITINAKDYKVIKGVA